MAVGGRINFEVDDGRFISQEDNCEMCNTTHYDGYCSQCEIHICQQCFDNHIKSKFCRDHVFVKDSNDNNKQQSAIRFELCDEHRIESKVYCTEHKCSACIECILLYHKTCKWEYIIKASEEFQSSGELTRLLEEVQGIEYTLDTYLEEIDKHTETAKALNKAVVSDIKLFAKSLVEYVAGSKQQVFEDAMVRESALQQSLDEMKKNIQSLGSQVGEILSDFRKEDVLHKRFILAIETMPKVALIQNELASIDCKNVIADYTFRPSNLLQRLMSNRRPIGWLTGDSQTEDGAENDDDIELKNERERNQSLQQQLMENQNEVTKLGKDLDGMKQRYDNDVKKLGKDLDGMKQRYDTVVKENNTLQLEISLLKLKEEKRKQFIAPLTCGHDHHIVPGKHNELIKCGTCGIISGDQPEGTFTSEDDGLYIIMSFTFPNGTQSKLNRNPGQPYSGATITGYLLNNNDGSCILNMMKLAFDRKCLFTVDVQGNINSCIELMENRLNLIFAVLYGARVRRQLNERGIPNP